jgi:rSAM/selenodomain-associated transferase 2
MRVTVIIPTLDEDKSLASAIGSVFFADHGSSGDVEVIVVDGCSTDNTTRIASEMGAKVLTTLRGRGLQMDEAASKAGGEILLFLHADTSLPEGWYEEVETAMADPEVVVGAFSLAIDSSNKWFRVIERGVSLRSTRLGLIYGDQAIFVRKSAFDEAGGFRNLPLMEDVDCVSRLKAVGKLRVLDAAVVTSNRRWEAKGILGNTVRNWLFLMLYYGGVSPERLHNWYYSH